MPGKYEIYDEYDLEEQPAELQPISEMDWTDLNSAAVQRMVDQLPDEMLEDVPGDGRLLCGVLATGVGLLYSGEWMPTVAGVVAFGLRPELVLPGMQLEVTVDGGEPEVWSGSLSMLVRKMKRHSILSARLGNEACPRLVGHAMAWRSWDQEHLGMPVLVEVEGDELVLRYPGAREAKVPNIVLADLLFRMGCNAKASAGIGSVKKALRRAGARLIGIEVEEDWTAMRVKLAARKEVAGEQVMRPMVSRPGPSPVSTEPVLKPRQVEKTAALVAQPAPGKHRSAEDRQDELVQILTERGRMPRRVLQRRLGWSRSTLRNVLRAAVEAGKVLALAPSPRSPFQVYQVVREMPDERPRPPAGVRWHR